MKRLLVIFLSLLSLTAMAQTDKLVRQITYEVGKVEGTIPQVNMLMKQGEKIQAREMVEDVLKQIEQIEGWQQQVLLVNKNADEEELLIAETNELKRFYTNKVAQLKNAIGIYIQCDAKLYDEDYTQLKEAVQGQLADLGCTFMDAAEGADWAVVISASARSGEWMDTEYARMWLTYVDVSLTIDKQATGKRVYQNAFSEKGGDPQSMEHAAREGYKNAAQKISAIIREQITQ